MEGLKLHLSMPKSLLFLLVSFLLALASIGLWRMEIATQVGWQGSAWLEYQHLSPFFIALFTTVAYIIPFKLWVKKPPEKGWLWPVIELYFASVVAYLIAKIVLLSLYGGLFGFISFYGLLALLLGVALLTAGSFHLTTRKRLLRVKNIQLLFLVLAIAIAALLSWLSGRIFSTGLGTLGLVGVVKTGFPFFWITIAMAATGRLTVRYFTQRAIPDTDPQILDDDSFLKKG